MTKRTRAPKSPAPNWASPTKKSQMCYKPAEVKTIRGKLSPRLMLVDKNTGITWMYNYDSLHERMGPEPDKKSDCWLGWKGAYHRQHFCLTHVFRLNDPNGKNGQMNVQRLMKAIELDRPLLKEEKVIATCKNPQCLNVKHLVVGTKKDIKPISRYSDEWLKENGSMILSTKSKELSEMLKITYNQAAYLKVITTRRASELGIKISKYRVEVIDLRKSKKTT